MKDLLLSDAETMIISKSHIQDIDNDTDWKLVELNYKLLKSKL